MSVFKQSRSLSIILLTYEVAGRGGNFIRCLAVAQALQKQGFAVTILCSNTKVRWAFKSTYQLGVKIVEVPCFLPYSVRHNGTSPIQVLNRLWYLWRNQVDVVYGFGHRPTVSIPTLLAGTFKKVITIADWSDLWGEQGIGVLRNAKFGYFIARLDGWMEKYFYKKVDQVTAISTLLLRLLKDIRGTTDSFLLPVGLNSFDIKPFDQLKARQKLAIPVRSKVVLFLGNADYDAHFLSDVFLLFRFNKIPVLFYCVGNPSKVLEKTKGWSTQQTKLITTGFVPHHEVYAYLAAADVVLLPYLNKTINKGRFPNKLSDYASAGKAIVTNATSDMQVLVKKTGLAAMTPDCAFSFFNTIVKILANEKYQHSLEQRALQAATHLSWEFYAQELICYLDGIARDNRLGKNSRRA